MPLSFFGGGGGMGAPSSSSSSSSSSLPTPSATATLKPAWVSRDVTPSDCFRRGRKRKEVRMTASLHGNIKETKRQQQCAKTIKLMSEGCADFGLHFCAVRDRIQAHATRVALRGCNQTIRIQAASALQMKKQNDKQG